MLDSVCEGFTLWVLVDNVITKLNEVIYGVCYGVLEHVPCPVSRDKGEPTEKKYPRHS